MASGYVPGRSPALPVILARRVEGMHLVARTELLYDRQHGYHDNAQEHHIAVPAENVPIPMVHRE